jgi:hypothetical protein
MANTRGGLLVYGVSDAIDMVGIDLSTVDDKQLSQWLRVHLQPTVSGVSYLMLPTTDGSGKDVLVVDIPASETAPHFLYGWQQKDKTTFNAERHVPYVTVLVLGESESRPTAWLVVAARPARPIPRMVPPLTRERRGNGTCHSRAASKQRGRVPVARL